MIDFGVPAKPPGIISAKAPGLARAYRPPTPVRAPCRRNVAGGMFFVRLIVSSRSDARILLLHVLVCCVAMESRVRDLQAGKFVGLVSGQQHSLLGTSQDRGKPHMKPTPLPDSDITSQTGRTRMVARTRCSTWSLNRTAPEKVPPLGKLELK